MSARNPAYPMPPHVRDEVEDALHSVPVQLRASLRQAMARTYAQGFTDGQVHGVLTTRSDIADKAEQEKSQ